MVEFVLFRGRVRGDCFFSCSSCSAIDLFICVFFIVMFSQSVAGRKPGLLPCVRGRLEVVDSGMKEGSGIRDV